MKTVKDFQTAQLAINELFEFKNRLETLNTDLGGRRFTNAGGAQDQNEFCTLHQLEVVRDSMKAGLEVNNKAIDQVKMSIGGLKTEIENVKAALKELSEFVAGLDARVSALENA